MRDLTAEEQMQQWKYMSGVLGLVNDAMMKQTRGKVTVSAVDLGPEGQYRLHVRSGPQGEDVPDDSWHSVHNGEPIL